MSSIRYTMANRRALDAITLFVPRAYKNYLEAAIGKLPYRERELILKFFEQIDNLCDVCDDPSDVLRYIDNHKKAQRKLKIVHEILLSFVEALDIPYNQQEGVTGFADEEYDSLKSVLLSLEDHYPTLFQRYYLRVGAAPQEGFIKAAHAAPMLSLDNAFSDEDVVE